MNYKIFIEYENPVLSNLCKKIYDLFLENNYDVTILDNNLSFIEKENIIKKSNNKKNIIIANKVNDNNSFELVYPLRNNDKLALSLNNSLNNINTVSKYYQRRDNNTTNLDYYKILRDINNNESIIIFYPNNNINSQNIASYVYQGVINYLKEENIYTVQSGDSLYALAKKFNTTVNDIKTLNNLTSNNLSIGQKLFIPQDNINNSSNNSPLNNIYIVKSGDSLYAIARKFNTTVDEIKKINNLSSNILSINQELIIPDDNINNSSSINTYIVKKGDTLYSISKLFDIEINELKRINNLTDNNLSIGQKLIIPNNNEIIYIVQSGDSLYAIARKFNTTVDDIKKANNLSSNNLSINQKLIIAK